MATRKNRLRKIRKTRKLRGGGGPKHKPNPLKEKRATAAAAATAAARAASAERRKKEQNEAEKESKAAELRRILNSEFIRLNPYKNMVDSKSLRLFDNCLHANGVNVDNKDSVVKFFRGIDTTEKFNQVCKSKGVEMIWYNGDRL